MVQVKEAVQKAQNYLPEIFQSAEGQELRLESVELTDDSKFWTITFSYSEADNVLGRIGRDYKTIKLSADNGQFFGARNGLSSVGLM